MTTDGGRNEGPERTDFQKSKELPDCGAHCEHIHGDQAPSAEDVVIASLQREVADLKEQLKIARDMLADESRTAIAIATDLVGLEKTVRHFLESGQEEQIHILWEQRLREAIGLAWPPSPGESESGGGP